MRGDFPRRPSYKATPQNSRDDGLEVVDFSDIYTRCIGMKRNEESGTKKEREREREKCGKSRRTREPLKETRGNSDLLHNNPLSQLVTLGSCVGPTVEGAA
ncbi:hypothetical protein ACS0PU_011069 [Formica fusca]